MGRSSLHLHMYGLQSGLPSLSPVLDHLAQLEMQCLGWPSDDLDKLVLLQ
jgi:hypothetical protein